MDNFDGAIQCRAAQLGKISLHSDDTDSDGTLQSTYHVPGSGY